MSQIAEPAPNTQERLQGFERADQTDAATLKLLEHGRSEILQITNYLEALYARLLAEPTGATTLTVIAEEKQKY